MINKQQEASNKKQVYRREFSAGGVVYKKFKVQSLKFKVKWLVGKHSGYHKWVLPKGLIEEGEKGYETAQREVEEEMGVRAKLVGEKAIHRVKYWYVADFKTQNSLKSFTTGQAKLKTTTQGSKLPKKRVLKYQESGGEKTKVFKVVSFYLMVYESGDPREHDWEMEEAGWYSYNEAFRKLAFTGEREALEKAQGKLLEVVNDKADS